MIFQLKRQQVYKLLFTLTSAESNLLHKSMISTLPNRGDKESCDYILPCKVLVNWTDTHN